MMQSDFSLSPFHAAVVAGAQKGAQEGNQWLAVCHQARSGAGERDAQLRVHRQPPARRRQPAVAGRVVGCLFITLPFVDQVSSIWGCARRFQTASSSQSGHSQAIQSWSRKTDSSKQVRDALSMSDGNMHAVAVVLTVAFEV